MTPRTAIGGLPLDERIKFTVLTPTYNRAHLLPRVYESLCAQTFREFEWLVIDDGSTDGTRQLLSNWKPDFPIHYVWKPNGGKHTALNLGAKLAVGEFIVITDSDDRPLAHALERFDYQWRQIPNPERFAFLTGLCLQEDGKTILGSRFPAEVVDVFTPGDGIALCDTDRWGIVRTDVLRQFPFPVYAGENFMLEGVVWNRILCRYGSRYFNEPLKIAGYAPGGLSSSGDLRPSNPRGASLYYRELAFVPGIPALVRAKAAINAGRFWGHSVIRKWRRSGSSK
jgi:glycosyltransferase involved in cell wall biosynthesis